MNSKTRYERTGRGRPATPSEKKMNNQDMAKISTSRERR